MIHKKKCVCGHLLNVQDVYEQGRTDEQAKCNKFFNFDEVIRIECDKARAEERAKVFDEVIKKLAESEDTILSDKQYYTLMELKEHK